MNPILELKGQLTSRKNPVRPMGFSLQQGQIVKLQHLKDLAFQLRGIRSYWENDKTINGAIISVYYSKIVAKSNRILRFLSYKRNKPNDSVRGAKFVKRDNSDELVHVFTHYVPLEAISKTIEELESVTDFLRLYCENDIDSTTIKKIFQSDLHRETGISRSQIMGILHDALYVSYFSIDKGSVTSNKDTIVTIFKTGIETKKLLSQYGINIFDDRIIDETTLRLHEDELQKLVDKAPYLISMQLTDFRDISPEDFSNDNELEDNNLIPSPKNEPTIGVIDTQFNTSVYFHEWVDYRNMLSAQIDITEKDWLHGTAVDSIIVDGPRGNPRLDDGCGRFKVRHFGVATAAGFSSFEILKLIRKIVLENPDIRVWNLSLGSMLEINQNFISPEGAVLDSLQREFNIIFVVAGTNIPFNSSRTEMYIGSPADSLNSIVVNSVDFNGKPASYTRSGPVLSFFNKPDLCYYGGDDTSIDSYMVVCSGVGARYVCGTSYAAPWIARKLAFMIEVMGFNREVAKALLIDSASGWELPINQNKMGYGIVPVSIDNVVKSNDDEIRFVMSATADEYETYTYSLPIPIVADAYPYFARVTLTYFPYCDRYQGVDYTGTEMDVHFGRVKIDSKGKNTIKSIDGNRQDDFGERKIFEVDARKMYRKWDNVKHISDRISEKSRSRSILGPSRLWGLSVKTKERKTDGTRDKIPFGLVITMKEMNGVNRIEEFIKSCESRGWIVNRIDIKNRLDIYAQADEEIVWE